MKRGLQKSFVAVTVLLCMSVWSVLPVFADLNTFKEDVEKEESQNRQSGQADTSGDEQAEGEESGGNPIARFFFEITIFAWAIHNNGVYYSAYPYAPPVSYSGGIVEGRPRNFINYDFSNVQIESGEELHITTAGLDFSIIQNDFFTWTAYGKGAFFDGVLERSGWAFGSWFRMYPLRPISLHLRTGGMFFPDITFGQVEAKLNLHLGRLQLYGGVNLLESEESRRLMTEAGAGIHF